MRGCGRREGSCRSFAWTWAPGLGFRLGVRAIEGFLGGCGVGHQFSSDTATGGW